MRKFKMIRFSGIALILTGAILIIYDKYAEAPQDTEAFGYVIFAVGFVIAVGSKRLNRKK